MERKVGLPGIRLTPALHGVQAVEACLLCRSAVNGKREVTEDVRANLMEGLPEFTGESFGDDFGDDQFTGESDSAAGGRRAREWVRARAAAVVVSSEEGSYLADTVGRRRW